MRTTALDQTVSKTGSWKENTETNTATALQMSAFHLWNASFKNFRSFKLNLGKGENSAGLLLAF